MAKPNPAKLSESVSHLRAMEERAIFSNFGPLSTSFEKKVIERLFSGVGQALTVCNATIGLMVAIRHAVASGPGGRRRYALMPSFTFAAAAQAAEWNRLTPLFCDINPSDWSADPRSERDLLEKYADEIAVVIPYATFGYDIDLSWYEHVQRHYGIPVVVDAAASLGTRGADGRGFGAGFSGSIVYSMHATKSFSTGEGGLLYSANEQTIQALRIMSNFGFGLQRNATLIGLNGKMSEVSALLANLFLEDFDAVVERRSEMMACYRKYLPDLIFQPNRAQRQAHQFVPVLLPAQAAIQRATLQEEMARLGIATATYFSPHVAEQEYFKARTGATSVLPVTNEVASRMLSLPLFDSMTEADLHEVVTALRTALKAIDGHKETAKPLSPGHLSSPMLGGTL